jgi:L-iditol 2-dehydrogenase
VECVVLILCGLWKRVPIDILLPYLKLGDRVTVMPLIHCGYCNYCRAGEYVLCDNYKYYGSRIDGAMAEYILVNADNVLKLPDNVGYEAGAMPTQ